MHPVRTRWGGRLAPALAVCTLWILTAGCDSGPPAGEPVADARPPEIRRDAAGTTHVVNRDPAERLLVYGAPEEEAQLLFMRAAAANPLPDGRSLWPDADGGRVIEFDQRGRVSRVFQGAPEGGRPLDRPLFALEAGDEVWAVEGDGSILRFAGDRPASWRERPSPAPPAAGGPDRFVATRTVREFDLGPVRDGEPLLWLLDAEGAELAAIGEVRVPDKRFLGNLVNTGWAAARQDAIWFAPALEPELLHFDGDGALLWRASLPAVRPAEPPRLTAVSGQVQPLFDEVQHGIAPGPDGNSYLLARGPDSERAALQVVDRDGRLVRSGEVPLNDAIYASSGGRVYALPPEEALARVDATPRAAFPPFELPRLDGDGQVALEAYRGRVVVVNFWASWCGPCRREMPELDRWARSADSTRVAVIGLNEDTDPAAARAFIRELGGVHYPVAMGGGRLRARYGYRGLPYTVVLDAELRVVKRFYGFGDSLDPVLRAVERELRTAGALAGALARDARGRMP